MIDLGSVRIYNKISEIPANNYFHFDCYMRMAFASSHIVYGNIVDVVNDLIIRVRALEFSTDLKKDLLAFETHAENTKHAYNISFHATNFYYFAFSCLVEGVKKDGQFEKHKIYLDNEEDLTNTARLFHAHGFGYIVEEVTRVHEQFTIQLNAAFPDIFELYKGENSDMKAEINYLLAINLDNDKDGKEAEGILTMLHKYYLDKIEVIPINKLSGKDFYLEYFLVVMDHYNHLGFDNIDHVSILEFYAKHVKIKKDIARKIEQQQKSKKQNV